MDKDRIPLHNLLDTALGFSIRDLVLNTPEEKAEFGRKLDELIKEAEARETAVEVEAEKEGKKP
jgi:hypothetical protein